MMAPVCGCTDTSTSSPFFSLNCSTTSRGRVTAREGPVCTILRVISVLYQYHEIRAVARAESTKCLHAPRCGSELHRDGAGRGGETGDGDMGVDSRAQPAFGR